MKTPMVKESRHQRITRPLMWLGVTLAAGGTVTAHAAQHGETPPSRYMGGPVELTEAPNGAIVNAEALEASSRILYLEPTTEKVAEGVWCIGGYSLANTTVIEGEDGLIVYDTGDTREEAEPMLEDFVRDDDGGITLYLQHDSPGEDKETNWLPAPEGPFSAVMRLYWPKKEALDGSWTMPPLKRAR